MVKFGSQCNIREHFEDENYDRVAIGIGLLSYRLLLGGLLATFTSFLAIKVFNPTLMEKIASSCKFTEFIFSKKFVLGLGIALMSVLLLAKLFSGLMSLCNQDLDKKANPNFDKTKPSFADNPPTIPDKPTKKEQFCMWTQVAIGISVSIAGIVCMSLMLANKISPEITSIMEKVFLGGFGIAIIASVLTGLAMLIGSIIINKSMTASEANVHNRNLNTMAEISGALFGGFGYAVVGTLPFASIDCSREYGDRDNYIIRDIKNVKMKIRGSMVIVPIKVPVTINFLDFFKIEFEGKQSVMKAD